MADMLGGYFATLGRPGISCETALTGGHTMPWETKAVERWEESVFSEISFVLINFLHKFQLGAFSLVIIRGKSWWTDVSTESDVRGDIVIIIRR